MALVVFSWAPSFRSLFLPSLAAFLSAYNGPLVMKLGADAMCWVHAMVVGHWDLKVDTYGLHRIKEVMLGCAAKWSSR